LLKHIDSDEIGDRKCGSMQTSLGQEHLHDIIEQVEEMLRTTCHIVIKGLDHDGHV